MFDRDPRDEDSRERDDAIRDRDDGWLEPGRGPGSMSSADGHDDSVSVDRDRDWREERDRESRDRDRQPDSSDPREVFVRDLDLPRGPERELVRGRDRDYSLHRADARTLSIVGAFRVVPERDLRDERDPAFDTRGRDLRHLSGQGLIERVALDGHNRAVVLTDHGRELLEHHREDRHPEHRQAFYAGADKARERTHDAQLYRAYLNAADRLHARGAHILRVELDRELKRDYQRFLQERNRHRSDSDGRPDRDATEIEQWAREHDLPYANDGVDFPDLRIEYDLDGHDHHEDIEVITAHYRGAHAASRARSGFTCYGSGGARGGASRDHGLAEDFL